MKNREDCLRKKVKKILQTSEEKRNFLPLFNCKNVKIFSEEERKKCLMETAKKYFKIKNEIINKNNVV